MKYESKAADLRKRFEKDLKHDEMLTKVAALLPDYLDDFIVHMHTGNLYGRVGSIKVGIKHYYSIDKDKRQPDIETMLQLLADLPPEPMTLVKEGSPCFACVTSVRPTATLDPKLIEEEHVELLNVLPVRFRCSVPYEGAGPEFEFDWYTRLGDELWEVNYCILPHAVRNMGYFSVKYRHYGNSSTIASVESADFVVNDKAKHIEDENGTAALAELRYYSSGSVKVPRSPYIVWVPEVYEKIPDALQALSFLQDKE